MRTKAVLAILAMVSLGTAFQSEAFRNVYPGFNDPKTVADQRMKAISTRLKLNAPQRVKVRAVYLDLAKAERQVIDSPGPKMLKRGRIGQLSNQADTRLRSLLTPKQYHLLKQWEASQHQPGSRPHVKM